MIKALIFDLDNTIYPVKSIANEVFAPINQLMDECEGKMSNEDLEKAKEELTRTPFQKVADQCNFPQYIKQKGIEILNNTTYDKPISPYEAYQIVQTINIDKFLVTFGFMKLQQSKVDMLNVRNHFKQVYVVDPEANRHSTKKNVFEQIMKEYGYLPEEVLVIGDDMESEIKAGKDLGMPTYLFDIENRYQPGQTNYYAKDYQQLKELIESQG